MFKRIKKAEDDPSLSQAQKYVKGWVERVTLTTGVLLVDEEAFYTLRNKITMVLKEVNING